MWPTHCLPHLSRHRSIPFFPCGTGEQLENWDGMGGVRCGWTWRERNTEGREVLACGHQPWPLEMGAAEAGRSGSGRRYGSPCD
jgi:hypothetical protein